MLGWSIDKFLALKAGPIFLQLFCAYYYLPDWHIWIVMSKFHPKNSSDDTWHEVSFQIFWNAQQRWKISGFLYWMQSLTSCMESLDDILFVQVQTLPLMAYWKILYSWLLSKIYWDDQPSQLEFIATYTVIFLKYSRNVYIISLFQW